MRVETVGDSGVFLLAALGVCLVVFGALVLLRFPDRPGGKLRFLGLEVNSAGAGLPVIALDALLVVLAATRDEDDGPRPGGANDDGERVFSAGTEVGDLDARGDKVVFTAPASGGAGATLNRLDLSGGNPEQLDRAPLPYDGIDVGIDRAGHARLVYSRCDAPEACALYSRSFTGPETPVLAATPGCKETRPSTWNGLCSSTEAQRRARGPASG